MDRQTDRQMDRRIESGISEQTDVNHFDKNTCHKQLKTFNVLVVLTPSC